MTSARFEDVYPTSAAYRELQPLRIPSGWMVGWNTLHIRMETDVSGAGGSSLFNATNEGRRFNIDVEFRPEFDPDGSFHLVVLYEPWPRSARGRRVKDMPFSLGTDAQTVHEFETRSYTALITELERWIARCTVWQREGQ